MKIIAAMTHSNCALCGQVISQSNDSREHVIPNSIGGRLRTPGFVCSSCNNTAGQTWDAELARQLNALCLFFGIVRERGKTPPEVVRTTAGEDLIISPDGLSLARPSYKEERSGSGVRIQVAARTRREARKMLEGIKRKYPNADISGLLQQATVNSSYPKGAVRFGISFGGETAGRSIVKTALSFAHHCGISAGACGAALSYLRDPGATACFGYYYERDLIAERPRGVPLHCVAISGNPLTGLLLGYVEYFGLQRVVVCLSDGYRAAPVSHAHAIDPTTGKELALSVELPFSAADIAAIYDYKMMPAGALQQAFAEIAPEALRRKFETEKKRVIDSAVEYAFANCGAKPGEMLTEQHMKVLSGLVAQQMTPFILRHIRRPR